jgi:hypothetical protein
MPATAHIEVTATELPQFRRLVRFLEDMDSLGRVNGDEEIQALAQECRDDLVAMRADSNRS